MLLFMELTSTISSSMIAVSSILSFDLYKTYFRPKASDRTLVHVSYLTVVFHAVFIAGLSIGMNYGNANMTWIFYFRPVLSCPGIIPLGLTLYWSRQTRLAAVVAPVLGFFTGLGIWLGTAKYMYGAVTMATTQQNYPALYGAIGSLFSPVLYSVVLSLSKPYQFDWREFLRIELIEEVQLEESTAKDEQVHDRHHNHFSFHYEQPSATDEGNEERQGISVTTDSYERPADKETTNKRTEEIRIEPSSSTQSEINLTLDNVHHPFDEETLKKLYHWAKISWAFFVVIVLITFVDWPMPLYRNYIFTKSFFSGWTTVAIMWQFFAFFAVVVYPLYDGRFAIAKAVTGVYGSLGK